MTGLAQKLSLIRMEFSATNFLEIYRDESKIYESEWFFNEPDHEFNPIEISDSHFCLNDPNTPIEFRLIRRN